MNRTINSRRYVRRLAGVLVLALASTLLNGCILTQLLGGLAANGGLLGGAQNPGGGSLTDPVTGALPGAGGQPPVTSPGGTPGTPAGAPAAPQLAPLAANLSDAAKEDIKNRDVDIQNKYKTLVAVYTDRQKYIDERASTPAGAARDTLERTITDRDNQYAQAERALSDAVAARNRVAAGQAA